MPKKEKKSIYSGALRIATREISFYNNEKKNSE